MPLGSLVHIKGSDFWFDGLEASGAEGAPGARSDGLRVSKANRVPNNQIDMVEQFDMDWMRREDLRVLKVPSEEPTWLLDEIMASMNRVNYRIQVGMNIEEFERQLRSVTTPEQAVGVIRVNRSLLSRASDA
ncbi:hypothetical protein V6N13_048964 [Hibiscus sabdariffa]